MLKAKPNLPTAEINAAWKRNGRGGTADNTLGKLVKQRKLKRTPDQGWTGKQLQLGLMILALHPTVLPAHAGSSLCATGLHRWYAHHGTPSGKNPPGV
jgi:hypothetical protein